MPCADAAPGKLGLGYAGYAGIRIGCKLPFLSEQAGIT
jgi:hypothetical protein